jgi:hypothetical protein
MRLLTTGQNLIDKEHFMKGVKILQWSTVATFVIFVAIGITILVVDPTRMTAFSQLLTAIFPLFIAEVVPAFLGTPLKNYIEKKGQNE